MAEIERLMIFMSVILHYLYSVTGKPTPYYMEEICDTVLPVKEPSIRLLLRRTFYNTNLDCFVTFEADNTSSVYPTFLMLVFHKMDIQRHTLHCRHFLEIKDGDSRDSRSVQDLKDRYCGDDYRPDGAYHTSGQYLSLRFVSDDTGDDDDFELIITPFHGGVCNETEFRCTAGGECISDNNKCDGYNHCGDGSDECKQEANYVAMIIVLVITGFLATGFAVYFFRRRRIQRGRVLKYPKYEGSGAVEQTVALQPMPSVQVNSEYPVGNLLPPPPYSERPNNRPGTSYQAAM